jgi:hypothetical protein
LALHGNNLAAHFEGEPVFRSPANPQLARKGQRRLRDNSGLALQPIFFWILWQQNYSL